MRLSWCFGYCLITLALISCGPLQPSVSQNDQEQAVLLKKPPLGWNSWDCWAMSFTESTILNNLYAFEQKLKPAGYEYFVLDDGWQYGWDTSSDRPSVFIDSFGRYLPDPIRFPKGLHPYIEMAHSKGIKFGIWLIRGAPLKSRDQDLTIKGTTISFRQALDTSISVDPWNGFYSWHGTSAFGDHDSAMQAYYNSVFELLAEWKIDFVKYDYITHSPDDIAAITQARADFGHNIKISLSPGCGSTSQLFSVYKNADMVRITTDVWDNRESIQNGFQRWELLSSYSTPGFWLDLDMIPFGSFPIYQRVDSFTLAQKETFMTQRALAASPLFMGGSLPESDDVSISLITDKDMLACNQNGICGRLVSRTVNYEIWKTLSSIDSTAGWVGVFNRDNNPHIIEVGKRDFGLDINSRYQYFNVWDKSTISIDPINVRLDADGVLFISYHKL